MSYIHSLKDTNRPSKRLVADTAGADHRRLQNGIAPADESLDVSIQCNALLHFEGLFQQLWPLVRDNATLFVGSGISLRISESGKEYDPEESADLAASFGIGAFGPYISLQVGEASPGMSDMVYRRGLFQRMLLALELDADIVIDTTMNVAIAASEIERLNGSNRSLAQTARADKRFLDWRPMLGPMSSLDLYCFSVDELETRVRCLVGIFGQEKIAAIRFSAYCKLVNYRLIQTILNGTGLSSWSVGLWGRQKYGLAELDQAITETCSFILPAFSFEQSAIGKVSAELWFQDGKFWFKFTCTYKNNEQEPALHRLIADLVGGKAIVDMTPR